MWVTVSSTVESVATAGTVDCAAGGRSVPIMVSASAVPHTGVEVSMTVVTPEEGAETDPSAGLTPDATVVTLSSASLSGILGFACAEGATGNTLNYVLAGTDAASFSLSSTTATDTTTVATVPEVTTVTSTVSMYVLPDPYATAYSSDAITAAATAGALDTALAAVEGVSAFGTMAAVTATAAEAETANAFSTDGVAGTASATAITLAGETTGAGYVLCFL